MSRLTASLLILVAASIWGTAFYFQKVAMDHVGPLQFLGFRGVLAALVLAPFAFREAGKSTGSLSKALPFAAIGGIVFFAAGTLQQFGISTATVTNTGFLTALYVVVTPFLLWLIQSERPTAKVWLAVVLAFVGIFALGGGALNSFSQGDIFIAASSIGWSFFMVITSMAGKLARPLQITCLTFVVLAVLGLGTSVLLEPWSWNAIREAAVAILFVGILSSALTYALIAMAVRHIPASHASILLATETLFAAAAGHIMLGERLTAIGWLGAGLVLLAVLVIQLGGDRSRSSGQEDKA